MVIGARFWWQDALPLHPVRIKEEALETSSAIVEFLPPYPYSSICILALRDGTNENHNSGAVARFWRGFDRCGHHQTTKYSQSGSSQSQPKLAKRALKAPLAGSGMEIHTLF